MDAAERGRAECADIIERLIRAGCEPSEARECALILLLRGERRGKVRWDDERTPVVDVYELDPSEAETSPSTPRAKASRVFKRPKTR